MDLLDLTLIGWLYAVVSGLVLVFGIVLVAMNYSRPETRAEAGKRILEDLVLFLIWLLGMVGGIGVLLGKGWSRPALELFCWTLMGLLVMTCWSRVRAMPPPYGMRLVQLALFVLPVVAVCIATILTLRSETALRLLAG
jgi:hypothetical protein